MKKVSLLICILYGGFTIFGSIVSMFYGSEIPVWNSVIMAIAGVTLIALNIQQFKINHIVIIVPLVILHLCAFINGQFFLKNLNYLHHLIRFIVSIIVFVVYRKAYK